jgi:hypothetical protein
MVKLTGTLLQLFIINAQMHHNFMKETRSQLRVTVLVHVKIIQHYSKNVESMFTQ